jgi:hypothetical protein
MKKETLEEAKERYLDSPLPHSYRLAVEFGAKYQQEQDKNKYSEEEVKQAYIDGSNNPIEEDDCYGTEFFKYMDDWFEQFKK